MGKLNAIGMSLVEVMVAMGVASSLVMVLAQTMSSSSKNSKQATLTSDWLSARMNIQLLMADPNQCTFKFGNRTISPATGGALAAGARVKGTTPLFANNIAWVTDELGPMRTASSYIGAPLLKYNALVGGLLATNIQVYAMPGNVSRTIKMEYPSGSGTLVDAYVDTLEFYITAERRNENGSVIVGLAQTSYESSSDPTKNNAIRFNVVRRTAAPNVIHDCYGLGASNSNAAIEACSDMGGSYDVTANPRCKLTSLYLGTNTDTYAPSDNASRGQRIQFWGTHGTKDDDNYAIGINGGTLWYNAGSASTDGHLFTNRKGGTALLTMTADIANVSQPFWYAGSTYNFTVTNAGAKFPGAVQIGSYASHDKWLYVFGDGYYSESLNVGDDLYVHKTASVGSTFNAWGTANFGSDIWVTGSMVALSNAYVDGKIYGYGGGTLKVGASLDVEGDGGNVIHACKWVSWGKFFNSRGCSSGTADPCGCGMNLDCNGDVAWSQVSGTTSDGYKALSAEIDCNPGYAGEDPDPGVISELNYGTHSVWATCRAWPNRGTGVAIAVKLLCCKGL